MSPGSASDNAGHQRLNGVGVTTESATYTSKNAGTKRFVTRELLASASTQHFAASI